jgi:ADP-ribose pyrophosphatase YjhB (NUDIX family)
MATSILQLDPNHGGAKPQAIRLGVGVFLRDEAGRLLLELRQDNNCWGLPGGRVAPGESIAQAAVREVEEETGLSVRITRLLGVYSETTDRVFQYPGDEGPVHKIDVILEGEILGGALRVSEESQTLQYFDLASLPERISPAARRPLADYCANRAGVIA